MLLIVNGGGVGCLSICIEYIVFFVMKYVTIGPNGTAKVYICMYFLVTFLALNEMNGRFELNSAPGA